MKLDRLPMWDVSYSRKTGVTFTTPVSLEILFASLCASAESICVFNRNWSHRE